MFTQSINKITILFPLLFLFSCGNSASSSSLSSSASSSSSSSSSSSESSSSSSLTELEKDKAEVQSFYDYLSSLNDHPNKVSGSTVSSYYYLTDVEPLEIKGTDTFVSTRYTLPASGLLERIGTIKMDSSSSKYRTDIYHDKTSFYKLTDYADDTEDEKQVLSYDSDYEEDNLNISIVYSDMANLEYMLENMGKAKVGYDFSFPESIESLDTLEYSYSLTIYETGTVPNETITHTTSFSLDGDALKKATTTYADDKYAGGVKANWSLSTSTLTFTQGDYEPYNGTLLDPKDFTSKD